MTTPLPKPKAIWIERVYDRFEARSQAWADRQGPGGVGQFLARLQAFPSVMLIVLAVVGPMWGLGHLGEWLIAEYGISRNAAGAIMMVGGLVTSMVLVFAFAIRRMRRLAARGERVL